MWTYFWISGQTSGRKLARSITDSALVANSHIRATRNDLLPTCRWLSRGLVTHLSATSPTLSPTSDKPCGMAARSLNIALTFLRRRRQVPDFLVTTRKFPRARVIRACHAEVVVNVNWPECSTVIKGDVASYGEIGNLAAVNSKHLNRLIHSSSWLRRRVDFSNQIWWQSVNRDLLGKWVKYNFRDYVFEDQHTWSDPGRILTLYVSKDAMCP